MKTFFIVLIFALGLAMGAVYVTAPGNYPPLQDGDLIFQTSTSHQASAIFAATRHLYTHMGLIKKDGDAVVVIEAAAHVKETPLTDWVRHGLLKRVAIYRYEGLTPVQAKEIVAAAKIYYGRPYDIFFSFENERIYCSELPYLAYRKVGLSIGTIQKVSELHVDNPLVKKLIEQRWQRHPVCVARKYDFEQCYQFILGQELITPASIAQDSHFTKIYSNYPF